MIIEKYFPNMMDTKKLRVQMSTNDNEIWLRLENESIFLQQDQVENVRDFLTKFLDGELSKSDDEPVPWIPPRCVT